MPASRTTPARNSVRSKGSSRNQLQPNPDLEKKGSSKSSMEVDGNGKPNRKRAGFRCTYIRCAESFTSAKELQAHKEESHYMKSINCPYPGCPVSCKKTSKNFDHHVASHGPPESWVVKEDGEQEKAHEDSVEGNSFSPPVQPSCLSRESVSSNISSASSDSAVSSEASTPSEFDFLSSPPSSSLFSSQHYCFTHTYASPQQPILNQRNHLSDQASWEQASSSSQKAENSDRFTLYQPRLYFHDHLDIGHSSSIDPWSSVDLDYRHPNLAYQRSTQVHHTHQEYQPQPHFDWEQHSQYHHQDQYQVNTSLSEDFNCSSYLTYTFENNGALGLEGAEG